MNELLDDLSPEDGAVIARVRAALDEVTAHDHDHDHDQAHGVVPVELQRSGIGAGRWFAIAAAAVLVVGAVTAIAVNRSNTPDVASIPTETSAAPSTEPVLIRSEVPWYVLASQDLVPGEVVVEPGSQSAPADLSHLVMAWARDGDPANGLLTLAEVLSPNGPDTIGESTTRAFEGGELVFQSYGLTAVEREALADQVVPGSGLPYVLPVDGWQYLALGQSAAGERRSQLYTALNPDPLSSILPTIEIIVGDYRGELAWLTSFTASEPVTVAGHAGWQLTDRDGTVVVFWQTPGGSWATMRIDPAFDDRVDGLIAAVGEVNGTLPTVETVPIPPAPPIKPTIADIVAIDGDSLPLFTPGVVDATIGAVPPMLEVHDAEGNRSVLAPGEDGPTLVAFVAEWDPHSQSVVQLLQDAMADSTIPPEVQVVLVVTASARDAAISWVSEQQWTGRVLIDEQVGDKGAGQAANAYGAYGWPYWVMVGRDGTVTGRATGELDQTQTALATLVVAPPDGVLGQLTIPAIGFDSPIVRSSEPTSEPSLSRGPTPDIAHALAVSMIDVGAAAPALDVLRPGDRITWKSAAGTREFEVTEVFSCTGADCSPENGEPLILFAEQQLTRIFATPVG